MIVRDQSEPHEALPCSRVPRGGRGTLSSLWRGTRNHDIDCGQAAQSLPMSQFPHISSHPKPSREQSRVSITFRARRNHIFPRAASSRQTLDTSIPCTGEAGTLGASPGSYPERGETAGLGVTQAQAALGRQQRLFPALGFPTAASCCPISREHPGEPGAAANPGASCADPAALATILTTSPQGWTEPPTSPPHP